MGTDTIIPKMQSLFKDGLIINSLARKYHTQNLFELKDLELFYKETKKKCQKNPLKDNYIACDLYYQSMIDPTINTVFVDEIVSKFNLENPLNDANMFLAFNIIEFKKKHQVWTNPYQKRSECESFLRYLDKFKFYKKNKEHSILLIYYQSVLYDFLESYPEFEKCNIELISLIIKEKEKPKSSVNIALLNYLESNNFFLNLIFQREKFAHNIIPEKNKLSILKIGLTIAEIYISKYWFDKSINLLETILTYFPENIKITKQYFLVVYSYLSYCSTILYDKERMRQLIKKIKIILINNDIQNEIKVLYDFILSTHKINFGLAQLSNENINSITKYLNEFKLESGEQKQPTKSDLLSLFINDYSSFYINIYAIGSTHKFAKKGFCYINNILLSINPKNEIKDINKNVINFIIGFYNIINKKSLYIIKEKNKDIIMDIRKEIQNDCNLFFSYIKRAKLPIFKETFIKNALIKTYFAYVNTYCENNNYNEAEVKIDIFDNEIKQLLNIKENEIEGYGYIKKIKGDLAFKHKHYEYALNWYNQSISSFGKENLKMHAIITFNKGLCYFLLQDKAAITHFNLSKQLFKRLSLCDEKINAIDQILQDVSKKK